MTPARISLIALDSERQPRAGFPNWVAQRPDLARILLTHATAIPGDAVGWPAEVLFSSAPTLTRIVSGMSRSLAGFWRTIPTGADDTNTEPHQ